jgi:hypothetical protein
MKICNLYNDMLLLAGLSLLVCMSFSSAFMAPHPTPSIQIKTNSQQQQNQQQSKLYAASRSSEDPNYKNNLNGELDRRSVLGTSVASAAAAATSSVLWTPQSAYAGDATPTATTVPKIALGKSGLEVSRTIQGYWRK